MKALYFICLFGLSLEVLLSLSGCAHFAPPSGEQQIQKKCHSVIGLPDQWVCEQP